MLASFGGFAVGSEPNLGLLACEQSRLSADAGLCVGKENAAFIAGTGKETGQAGV